MDLKHTLCIVHGQALLLNNIDTLDYYCENVYPYGVHGGGEFELRLVPDSQLHDVWWEGEPVHGITREIIEDLKLQFVPAGARLADGWYGWDSFKEWDETGIPSNIYTPVIMNQIKIGLWRFEISLDPTLVVWDRLTNELAAFRKELMDVYKGHQQGVI